MKSYYVFICLDGVPILELLLDNRYQAIKNFEKVNWNLMKYKILDFKSVLENGKMIEKGEIKYHDKILTKNLTYYRINIENCLHTKKTKIKKTKLEEKIINLAVLLFSSEPIEFINFIKNNNLLLEKDIHNLEKSLETLNAEKELISTWKKAI